jgi:hypothetical protein
MSQRSAEAFRARGFEPGDYKAPVLTPLSIPGLFAPVFPEPPVHDGDGIADAAALGRRIQALREALKNLPRHAARLARWRARGELVRKSQASPKPARLSPFLPGFAPGFHRTNAQEIDSIIGDCPCFAVKAWNGPDTS